jgi:hypothetical protein
MTDHPSWVPQACTLPTADRPLRRAEFDDLFSTATSIERPARRHARVRLAGAPGLADRVADLAARENECCSFFTFTVTTQPSGDVALDIEVPAAYTVVLDALVARAERRVAT